MAKKTITQDVALSVSLGAMRGEPAALKALSKFHEDATKTGFGKGLTEGGKKLQEQFGEAVHKAMTIGSDGFHKKLKTEIKEYGDQLREISGKINAADKKMRESKDIDERRRLSQEKQNLKKQAEVLMKAQQVRIGAMDKALERQVDAFKKGMELSNKDKQELFAEGGEVFTDVVGKGLSTMDVTDFANNITGAIGGGLKHLTSIAAFKSGKMAQDGDTGGMQKALALFSKGALVIAGVTAAVAGLVAMFGAAYGQTKDFNRAIMEGTSSMDLMGDEAFKTGAKLSNSLEEVRRASLDVAYETRQTTEEVIGMLTAFNQAGLTFREMKGFVRDAGTQVEAYAEMARFATTASLSLGISVSEVASQVNEMNRDMGMGLERIEDSFGLIYSSAGKAGMNVKDFFTSVNEAASGMALYNIRLEDTIGLMLGLTKTMGEQRAKELMGQKGEFKDATTLDKYKTVMTSGGASKEIIGAQADKQMLAFEDAFADVPDDMVGVLKTASKDILGAGGQLDASKIAKLTESQTADIAVALQDSLGTKGMTLGSQLFNLTKTMRAQATGKGFDIADAMGKMDQMGDMAMKMVKANALVGNRTMASMKGLTKAAFEEVTGLAGESFDTFAELQMKVASRLAKDTGRKTSEITGTEVAAALAGPDAAKYLGAEDQAKMQELQDKSVPVMERLAEQQLVETKSISATLKNVIADSLETISGWLESLVGFFADEDEEQALANAMKTSADRIEELRSAENEIQSSLKELKKQAASANPETKKALEGVISGLEEQREAVKDQIKIEKDKSRDLRRGKSVTEAGFKAETGMEFNQDSVEALLKASVGYTHDKDKQLSRDEYNAMTPAQHEMVDAISAANGDPKKLGEMIKLLKNKERVDQEAQAKALKEQQDIDDKRKKEADDTINVLEEMLAVNTAMGDATLKPLIENLNKNDSAKNKMALRRELSKDGWTDQERAIARRYGIKSDQKVEDFIYRGNELGGRITPINQKDQFLGMKPNGPIDQVLGRRGGGGGGTVNIHISGGDESKVYAVVKKALRDSGIQTPTSSSG